MLRGHDAWQLKMVEKHNIKVYIKIMSNQFILDNLKINKNYKSL